MMSHGNGGIGIEPLITPPARDLGQEGKGKQEEQGDQSEDRVSVKLPMPGKEVWHGANPIPLVQLSNKQVT
jgi:hypothetical protein